MLILLLTIVSCKKETDQNNLLVPKNIESKVDDYYLKFYFPDTVNINHVYHGGIFYKGALDTITSKFFVKGDTMRFLSFYLKDNKSHIKNRFEHILKSKEIDTFYSLEDNGDILFEHKFNNLGINYLEGVLLDEVLINTSDTSGLKIHSKYNHITLPVFVTDDENIIDSFYKDKKPQDRKIDKKNLIQGKI